jgi:hypothetical protein
MIPCSLCRVEAAGHKSLRLLLSSTCFLTSALAARASLGDKDVVGRRQFRGLQAVEDELGLDHPPLTGAGDVGAAQAG